MKYDTSVQRTLRALPSISSFEGVLNSSTLSELDKQILRMHYLEEKNFAYIGDVLGYSESGIRKRHLRAMKKIGRLF